MNLGHITVTHLAVVDEVLRLGGSLLEDFPYSVVNEAVELRLIEIRGSSHSKYGSFTLYRATAKGAVLHTRMADILMSAETTDALRGW